MFLILTKVPLSSPCLHQQWRLLLSFWDVMLFCFPFFFLRTEKTDFHFILLFIDAPQGPFNEVYIIWTNEVFVIPNYETGAFSIFQLI